MRFFGFLVEEGTGGLMIRWDDLKHIHVIRKLEDIVSQWFHTDILFLDERGQIRNFDASAASLGFKSPLTQVFLKNEKGGRALFLESLKHASETIQKSPQQHLVLTGPGGIEKFFISKIMGENEFLGSVVACSYLESGGLQALTEESTALGMSPLKKAGDDRLLAVVDQLGFEQALKQMKVLDDGQKQYFYELIDLVAQEINTFHMEIFKREERIIALNSELGNRYSYDSMIGKAKPMQDLYALLDKIRSSESTVLIQGENGTGKELIARAIHFHSPRQNRQFITVNCSAFNENLLDSELFGHVKGSFTGAIRDKKGLLETADHGTLFLDEIGDMPQAMQVKLLRVLQEGSFTPVGGNDLVKVDVRVLAATNKDLKEMVEDGIFREDLYYRINVINLWVPALRERKEDIPILVDHFMNRGCKEKNIPLKSFAKRTLEKFFDYPWPGNIRELENEVERLLVLSGDEEKIPSELLSSRIRDFGDKGKIQGTRVSGKLKDALEDLEKVMIRDGLKRTNWNKSRLSKELGISRAGLIMKVEKYHLDKRKLARAGSNGSSSGEAA